MANQWLRLWHDMPTDPKWRTIAKASGQRIGDVMAVYCHLLVCGSNAAERGRTQSFCSEDVASSLDMETEQVEQIITAMQGRVLDADMLMGWEKRQVAREDGASERAKAWREAKKQAKTDDSNATERNRTQTEREQTPDKIRVDKEEEEGDTQKPADFCPHQQIIDLYHAELPTARQIREWTPARKAALRSRWREKPDRQTLDWWQKFFAYVAKSDFLCGRSPVPTGRKPFELSLDWLCKPDNFVKVLEGAYES